MIKQFFFLILFQSIFGSLAFKNGEIQRDDIYIIYIYRHFKTIYESKNVTDKQALEFYQFRDFLVEFLRSNPIECLSLLEKYPSYEFLVFFVKSLDSINYIFETILILFERIFKTKLDRFDLWYLTEIINGIIERNFLTNTSISRNEEAIEALHTQIKILMVNPIRFPSNRGELKPNQSVKNISYSIIITQQTLKNMN
jgi:hypothetical protein